MAANRDFNPDNPIEVALTLSEAETFLENPVSFKGVFNIHPSNVMKCTPEFVSKMFSQPRMLDIKSRYNSSQAKMSICVLDIHDGREEKAWVDMQLMQPGKTWNDILAMFEKPAAENGIPRGVRLTAIAGQHSTIAAKELNEEGKLSDEQAVRRGLIFTAGEFGGLTNKQLRTLGMYDNLNLKLSEYTPTPAGLLSFFITQARTFDLSEEAGKRA